jgi:hypothetical protein
LFSLVIWLLNTNNHPLFRESDSVQALFTLHDAGSVGDEVLVVVGVAKLGEDEGRSELKAQEAGKCDLGVLRRFLQAKG